MATASKIGSDRPVTTAIILAAGGDDESRELLHAELSDSTVAALAVQNLRQVLPAERIIVVIAPEDQRIREALGEDLTYVVQEEPLGTGNAVAAARGVIPDDTEQLLVTYADTPLLRPASLRGLLNRHNLKKAGFSLLTARMDQPLPYGRIERDSDGRITAIVEPEDLTSKDAGIAEVNVGSYVAAPDVLS